VERVEVSSRAELSPAIFGSLEIPGLGPTPSKPKFRVQFDLNGMGSQESWFHWVNEHDGCVSLIYDTRFEYGIRYSPPNLGPEKPIKIRIPEYKKEYMVYSLNLQLPFGCFHITTLILASQPGPQTHVGPGGPPTAEYILDLSKGLDSGYNFNSPTFFEEGQQEYYDDQDG
jgi:hypothetical protein